MYSYRTGLGGTVTITSGSVREIAFLQGDEGAELLDELEACENEAQVQDILSKYDY